MVGSVRTGGVSDMAEKQGGGPKWEVANAIQVKFRCPEDLKNRVDTAAMRNEVTISSEIGRRLEESFLNDRQSMFEAAFFGGERGAELLRMFSALVSAAANRGNFEEDASLRHALIGTMLYGIRKMLPFDQDIPSTTEGFHMHLSIEHMGVLRQVADAFLQSERADQDAEHDDDVKYA